MLLSASLFVNKNLFDTGHDFIRKFLQVSKTYRIFAADYY